MVQREAAEKQVSKEADPLSLSDLDDYDDDYEEDEASVAAEKPEPEPQASVTAAPKAPVMSGGWGAVPIDAAADDDGAADDDDYEDDEFDVIALAESAVAEAKPEPPVQTRAAAGGWGAADAEAGDEQDNSADGWGTAATESAVGGRESPAAGFLDIQPSAAAAAAPSAASLRSLESLESLEEIEIA